MQISECTSGPLLSPGASRADRYDPMGVNRPTSEKSYDTNCHLQAATQAHMHTGKRVARQVNKAVLRREPQASGSWEIWTPLQRHWPRITSALTALRCFVLPLWKVTLITF